MILYHGSDVVVENPKIFHSEKGRDFGMAFYLTPIKEQAERMAKRTQKRHSSKKAVVSVFEYQPNQNLKIKQFPNPDIEWLDLILKCRSNPSYKHGFDIVEGKIADDNVGETVLFVLDKVISKEDAVKRLKYHKINSQIAFCSNESLKTIHFVNSYEVK